MESNFNDVNNEEFLNTSPPDNTSYINPNDFLNTAPDSNNFIYPNEHLNISPAANTATGDTSQFTSNQYDNFDTNFFSSEFKNDQTSSNLEQLTTQMSQSSINWNSQNLDLFSSPLTSKPPLLPNTTPQGSLMVPHTSF